MLFVCSAVAELEKMKRALETLMANSEQKVSIYDHLKWRILCLFVSATIVSTECSSQADKADRPA